MVVRFAHFALLAGLCISGALKSAVGAQVPPPVRVPDSVRIKTMACGTHGPTLQVRQATMEVRQALSKVVECPEGPEAIAKLWTDGPGSDRGYLATLASVSSLASPRVANALVRTFADRGQPTEVRLQALGVILSQMTTNYASWIEIKTGDRSVAVHPSEQRAVGDSIRFVAFATASTHRAPPVPIAPALRSEIIATITRVAADPMDDADIRLAAAGVVRRLGGPD